MDEKQQKIIKAIIKKELKRQLDMFLIRIQKVLVESQGNEFMTYKGVSAFSGFTVSYLREEVRKGKLKCLPRKGRVVRFKRIDVENWMEGKI